MSRRAKVILTAAALAWYFLPAVADVPFGGPPVLGFSLFAWLAVWVLVAVVLPWRKLGSVWVWLSVAGLVTAAGLKLTAWFLHSPQGMTGTYRWLPPGTDLKPFKSWVLDRPTAAVDEPAPAPAAPKPNPPADPPAGRAAAPGTVGPDTPRAGGALPAGFASAQESTQGSGLAPPARRQQALPNRRPDNSPARQDPPARPPATVAPGTRAPVADPPLPPMPAGAAGPWVRCDRGLRFRNNGWTPWGDSLHLTPFNAPAAAGCTSRPEPDLATGALLVVWRGVVDFPRQGVYVFQPDTDGWWSVEIEGLGVVDSGGPGLEPLHTRRSIDPVPQQVTIRWLRPPVPPGGDFPARFELRWDPPRGSEQAVGWRRLHPGADVSDTQIILNRTAEGLTWGGFGTACVVMVLWLVFLVDWARAFRPFFTDRMVLWLLAVFAFGAGFLEVTLTANGDDDWNRPDDVTSRTAIRRALLLSPGMRPARTDESGTPGPAKPAVAAVAVAAAVRPDKPPVVEGAASNPPTLPAPDGRADPASDPGGGPAPVQAWLRMGNGVAGGLLGPTRWADRPGDAVPAFPDSPLQDYWLAGLLTATEHRPGLAAMLQVLLTCAALPLVYVLGRRLAGARAGLLAAGVLASDPHFSHGPVALLADHPAALLLPAAVLSTLWARRFVRGRWFALSGIVHGLLVLMRPDLVGVPLAAAAWWLWPKQGDPALRRRLSDLAIAAVPLVVMLSLVPVRNRELTGRYEWLPTAWTADVAATPAATPNATPVPSPAGVPGKPATNPVGTVGAVADLDDPAGAAGRAVRNFLAVWGWGRWLEPDSPEPGRSGSFIGVRYVAVPILYALAAAWAVMRLRRVARPAESCLLLTVMAAVVLPMMWGTFEDRRRQPLAPLAAIFAGTWLASRRQTLQSAPIAPGVPTPPDGHEGDAPPAPTTMPTPAA